MLKRPDWRALLHHSRKPTQLDLFSASTALLLSLFSFFRFAPNRCTALHGAIVRVRL
jgi:hypothetical protein